MIPLTADDSRLLKDLQLFIEPVGVYDPAGKLLGLYVPANLEPGKMSQTKSQFDPAELKRRLESEQPSGNFSELVGRVQLLSEELNRRRAAGEKDFTLEEAHAFLTAKPNRLT